MLRRTVGYGLTVVLVAFASYQLAWHKDLRSRFFDHPFQSVGLLLLVIAAIGLVVWSTVRPHYGSAPLGMFLGAIATVWGSHLLHGIKWTTLGLFGMSLVVLAILFWITVEPERSSNLSRATYTLKERIANRRAARRARTTMSWKERLGYRIAGSGNPPTTPMPTTGWPSSSAPPDATAHSPRRV